MQIFYLFCKKKPTFLYFTQSLLQNTHINLSILRIYSIKYSFFLHFLLFPFLLNKLTNSSSPPSHTHTQPATFQQNPSTKSVEPHPYPYFNKITHTYTSIKSPTPSQPASSSSSYRPNTNPKSPIPSHHQQSNRTNLSESPAFTKSRPSIVRSWFAETAGRFHVIGDERSWSESWSVGITTIFDQRG